MRLLIDTDPGVDDGVALAMALRWPGVAVEAISVVAGNTDLQHGVRNSRLVTEICGMDVPVYAGAGRPLVRPFEQRSAWIHGQDGFGDLGLQPRQADADPGFAPDRMVEAVMKAPGQITLVTLGPLTNVALALAREPRIARSARALVMMGGTAFAIGNRTPVAEFNVHVDPEAARVVLAAGFDLTMIGIELSRGAARLTDGDLEAITAADTPVADLVSGLLRHSLAVASRRPQMPGERGAACPDGVTIAAVLDPDVLTESTDAFVDVETAGELTTGMTVIDRLGVLGRPANVRVGMAVDAVRFKEVLLAACRKP